MGSGLWRDLAELVRSAGLAGRLPPVRGRVAEYVAEFDRVVAPIMARFGAHAYLDDATYEVCAKLSFLLAAYATTAGVPFRTDIAVLGGAVARVYDDLIDSADIPDDTTDDTTDDSTDDSTDARVAGLFSGEAVTPRTTRERVLHALYRELERQLARDRDDPVYAALLALHDNQIRSRTQRDPAISPATLTEITRAKGGHAMVVFVGLLHPGMTERQVAVARELGAVLQLLDDYVDVAADRRSGITTSATRHDLTLAHICRQLRSLRPALRACLGRDQPLSAVLYLTLWFALLRHRCPGWPARHRPFRVLVRVTRERVRSVNSRREPA
ncbi:class 1 isoprenoid biosynthesis enzyme [Actinophytocola sp.]|uniref:class 1 isoprenoid biosynthesis enzyme n=1 Tax=Actinophytocola sp. TaxID=1872138 RepID=UPI003D6C093B